jgi:hypothetical protein
VDERYAIRVDDDDLIAAAQILAWIARPHRPESAVKLLNEWYLRLLIIRGVSSTELPFLPDKKGRLDPKFYRLQTECMTGFRAGTWLNWKILSAAPHKWFASVDISTRELGRRRAQARHAVPENELPDNEIRDVWSKRKPIAHLALGAGQAIGRSLAAEGLQGFGLSKALLNPGWVNVAIASAEEWAHSASSVGVPEGTVLHRFHRDTF